MRHGPKSGLSRRLERDDTINCPGAPTMGYGGRTRPHRSSPSYNQSRVGFTLPSEGHATVSFKQRVEMLQKVET